MKTADVMQILIRERPNGVSFDPMSLRLLRQLIPLEDELIEELKDEMFQLGDRLWFDLDMITSYDDRRALQEEAENWLRESPCFSISRLFENYSDVLRHISTTEHFATFLRQLGFSVAEYGQGGFYAFRSTSNLGESLASIADSISEWQEGADGLQALTEIEAMLPNLTIEALEDIRKKFLPGIHVEEIGGVPCWRSAEAVHLPEDFSDMVTDVIDALIELGKKVDTGNLEFALDLFYRMPFRESYSLTNRRVFMSTCAKHYKGSHIENGDFSREFVRDWTKHHEPSQESFETEDHLPSISHKRRQRSANTRFDTLGVPIGAQLEFTKGSHITCTVLDPINQVEYDGKPWAISALAMHLMNGVVANGFAHFCYQGEILLDRRTRMDRENEENLVSLSMIRSSPVDEEDRGATLSDQSDSPEDDESTNCWKNINSKYIKDGKSLIQENGDYRADDHDREIIGLEGRPLKPETWKAFRSAGTDPRVAEWARRVEQGELVEDIAYESGYAVSTMKNMISNFNLYFKVCASNNILPEGCSDV